MSEIDPLTRFRLDDQVVVITGASPGLGSVGGVKLRIPGYAAAKGGLHNLTRELASEWARKGVRVNAIAPMGRTGEIGELDGAMLFLASDASSFVTGQIIHVDGGWTAT